MENEILELLENDSRISAERIAVILDKSVEDVKNCIKKMEEEQIICGYNTIINWDKTQKEFVTALVEVRVTPQRDRGFDQIAKRIYN